MHTTRLPAADTAAPHNPPSETHLPTLERPPLEHIAGESPSRSTRRPLTTQLDWDHPGRIRPLLCRLPAATSELIAPLFSSTSRWSPRTSEDFSPFRQTSLPEISPVFCLRQLNVFDRTIFFERTEQKCNCFRKRRPRRFPHRFRLGCSRSNTVQDP